MKGLYEAGIIAAGRQIVASVLLTAALTLSVQQPDAHDLGWVCLAAALVVVEISRAALSRGAARMAVAAEELPPARKARVLLLSEIRLKMMAVAAAVLTLMPPPWLWLKLLSGVFSEWVASLSWPAVASAGVVFAIVNARAARAARTNPIGRASSLPPNSTCAR